MGNFFDGYYYKHQKDGNTVCLIVGRSSSGDFVQVITNEQTLQFEGLHGVQVGKNGLRVELPNICGQVAYGPFTPLRSDIMGPFRWLPMQCSHRVVSMRHTLTGSFTIAGKKLNMSGGIGYIEGDRGRSFPREYLWLHCNDFPEPVSIMASVADIPFAGFRFMGCICAIIHSGKEYRLATYTGVRIREAGRDRLVLEQGRLRLEADIDVSNTFALKAPKAGRMTDTIHESNCSTARFRFWQNGVLLFDLSSPNVSFECNLKADKHESPAYEPTA